MSTPPDQLPGAGRKTSVGKVLAALNAAESGPAAKPASQPAGPASDRPAAGGAAPADGLAEAKRKYLADKTALENGDLKKVPPAAPKGLEATHAAVQTARAALPADPKTLAEVNTGAQALATLADKVRLYLEAAAAQATAKAAYEKGLASHKADLDKANAADTAERLPLEKAKSEYEKRRDAMLKLAADADYARATAALDGVADAAKALNVLVAKYEACVTLLYGDGKADRSYLDDLDRNSPPSTQTRDALAQYKALMRQFHGGQYDECVAAFKELRKGIADLKKAVAEADKVAQPKADAAAKKFEKLAGDKKLSTLNATDTVKLVAELKKLPQAEQAQMLADLHGPSGKLDAEGRLMQRAMYKAMTLDTKFKQEDQKKRDAYRADIEKDTETQDAVSDWNAKDAGGKDKVSMQTKQKVFEKVLIAQSKAYDIPVPAIRWYAGKAGSYGSFNTTSGIISLNTRYLSDPQEMIDTILHENAHNFQDQLVKRFFAGEIKESDPMYEQAKTFAMTHHWDAYVTFKEDSGVYEAQPEEMHAWDSGRSEAPKLMRELAAAKAKREGRGS